MVRYYRPGEPEQRGSVLAERSSRVVLGGPFGEEPIATTYSRIQRFVERGGRLIETAHSYAGGRAEETLGDWLRASRDVPVRVVSKVCHPLAEGRSRVNAAVIRAEVELSVRRLGVPLDLALLHRDDPVIPVEELVAALEWACAQGLIRGYGVANWTAPRLARFAAAARSAGHKPWASYQYSLARPVRPIWPGALAADAEILEVVRTHDLPMLAWAAQARGWFADPDHAMSEHDRDCFYSERNVIARQRCRAIGLEVGVAPATVALAWLLDTQPNMVASIGPRTVAETDASMAAVEFELTPAQLNRLGAPETQLVTGR
jgi:1-deoxyxylulose-5-phosphate synthase